MMKVCTLLVTLPRCSRNPILHVEDIPKYQQSGSLAARIAMENGYVLDSAAGKIVGRIDVGEVLAVLRGRPTGTMDRESGVMATTEEAPVERPSGFFTKAASDERAPPEDREEPLAATG
jgi:hypothetical protein